MTKDSRELLARIGTALYEPDALTRQETEALYDTLDALVAEVERLRAEVERLRALGVSLHKAAAAGRDAERAAVVAWLRAAPTARMWQQAPMDDAADHIERGEHRREEEK